VDDAAGDVAAHRDGVLERLNCQAGLHPRADRVPDDLAAAGVFDGAAVELAFGGLVLRDLRDVDEPELVRGIGGEDVPGPAVLVDDGAEVVVDRRSRLLAVTGPFSI